MNEEFFPCFSLFTLLTFAESKPILLKRHVRFTGNERQRGEGEAFVSQKGNGT